MKYLLDTHAFIGAAGNSNQLSGYALKLISSTRNDILVSAVSIYEIELQFSLRRRIQFPVSPTELINNFGYQSLSISQQHAETAARLPLTHRDPWDRILAAQAIVENMPIISRDDALRELGAEVVW